MRTPVRVLIAEDYENDADLILNEMRRGGYEPRFQRVDTKEDFQSCLDKESWDLIMSDYVMPSFSGTDALRLAKAKRPDIPFILFSGKIDEETAVEAMKAGARDIVLKGNLSRLVPAIKRELQAAAARKVAEEALRTSEQINNEIITTAYEGIILCDVDLRYVVWNPFMEELTGLPADQVLGRCALEAFPHLTQQGIDSYYRRALAGEMVKTPDTPFDIPQTGKTGWVAATYWPRRNDRGEIVGVIGIVHDITERKRHEEALRQSERRLDLALKGSGLAFWDLNVRTGEAIFDERWAEILGYPVTELTSNLDAWQNSLHPDDLTGTMAELMDHLEGKKSDYYTEYRIRTRSGNWKWIADSGKICEWDDDGKPLRAAGTHLDITERKQAEQELRESESRFRLLIEGAPDGIFVQTEGRISYVNNAMLLMFGARSAEELLGRPFMELIHPDFRDRVRERARIVVEEKRPIELQYQVYLKLDGTPIDVEVSVVPIRYYGRDGALVFIRDISERKEAEKTLQESEKLFRSILEKLPVGVLMIDQNGQLDMVNPAGQKIWGGSRDDCIDHHGEYRGWWVDTGKCIAPEQWNAARAIRNGEISINEEIEIESFDASRKFILSSALPIWDSAGWIKGAIAVNVDITAQKLAEKAYREQARFLQVLIDTIPTPVFFKDRESCYIGCNNEFLKFLGKTREAIVGKSVFDLAPRHRAEENQAMDEKLFLDRSNQVYEQRAQYADGTMHDVIINKALFTDEAGNIKGLVGVMLDVTEQKKSEKSLRESTGQIRALIDNIPDIVWLKDKESRYIAANEPFGKVCGLKPEELVGKTDLDLWPKELAESYRADDWAVIQSGRSKRVEEFLEDSTGKRICIETFKTPIRDDRGDVIGTTGIARDITERKHIEDLYRMLSDRSLAGVYVVQDGIFRYINANAASYAGYCPDELVGRESSVMIHPEDLAIARKLAGEMLRGVRQTPYEFRIIDKTGETRWILETVTTIPYEGKPAVLGNSMDVTQIKEAQRKLEDLKALESSVLAAIPHAVMGARNRHIFFANEGVENVFGWKREELINKSTRILFRSDEAYEDFGTALYTTLEKEKTISGEYDAHFRHKEGRNLICRVTASRIGETLTDQYITTTIEDVTGLRNIQLQLLQSEKMSSIGQLAAGVAHEINNPTGYVSSNLKTLEEYFTDMNAVLSKYEKLLDGVKECLRGGLSPESLSHQADAIDSVKGEVDLSYILNDIPNLIQESRQGTERIRNIVIDLKNFAHPGKAEFELADIVKNIESTLNVVWNELKYKATIHKDYGELPPVMCIPQQLNQVFMNILVNAAHAIKDKGDISISTRRQDGHVEIAIRDTGCGIPKANISKIFDPFFTTKEVGKGTGLGLNVAYNIVNKHHGSIDVTSEVGEGTTFTIRLPVHQEEGRA